MPSFSKTRGLNFWISAEISMQLCSPNNIQYEYANGSKRQVDTWLLHRIPQLVAQIPLQLCLLIVCKAKYLLTYLLTRLFTFIVNSQTKLSTKLSYELPKAEAIFYTK